MKNVLVVIILVTSSTLFCPGNGGDMWAWEGWQKAGRCNPKETLFSVEIEHQPIECKGRTPCYSYQDMNADGLTKQCDARFCGQSRTRGTNCRVEAGVGYAMCRCAPSLDTLTTVVRVIINGNKYPDDYRKIDTATQDSPPLWQIANSKKSDLHLSEDSTKNFNGMTKRFKVIYDTWEESGKGGNEGDRIDLITEFWKQATAAGWAPSLVTEPGELQNFVKMLQQYHK